MGGRQQGVGPGPGPLEDEEIVDMDFAQQCVACCPLEGPHYEADKRKVHQLIRDELGLFAPATGLAVGARRIEVSRTRKPQGAPRRTHG